jgi:WD40 repeat protein
MILKKHTNHIRSLSFSPNGNFLASGSADNKAYIWILKTQEIFHEIKVHKDTVRSVSFSPDGRHFLTSSSDNTAYIWNTDSGKIETTFK